MMEPNWGGFRLDTHLLRLLLRRRTTSLVCARDRWCSIKAAARGVRPHVRHSPTAARRRCHTWSADGRGAYLGQVRPELPSA
jgi:hypothetical protein